ncbi:MAG: hypothetical protein KDB30_00885, partial [Tetrasphaera sp.]|nr:hypothetical protein [Tetrasphaera sp.]
LSAWLVREWSGTPSNLTAGEHVAIGWFDKKDLPEPSHPLMRPALESAIEALVPDPACAAYLARPQTETGCPHHETSS